MMTETELEAFTQECFAELKKIDKKVSENDSPTKVKRILERRRKAKDEAKQLLATDSRIKKAICAGIKDIKGDLKSLITKLIAIFGATALLGNPLTPVLIAAIALIISKAGLTSFCAY